MGTSYLTVYELVNDTLGESVTTSDPFKYPQGWDLGTHEIRRVIVDPAVPRRSAAGFIGWYVSTRRRLGWKVVSAAGK